VTTGLAVCSGEVKTNGYVDIQKIVRETIEKIGYTKAEYRFDYNSCGIITTIHEQSSDINQGVERANAEEQGAGDQGMMFGYATNETDNYMPLSIDLAHRLLEELAVIRRENKKSMDYLRPDAKSQVTIEYADNGKPLRIDTIVISTQHDEFVLPADNTPEASKAAEKRMQERIHKDIAGILIPRVKKSLPVRLKKLFNDDYRLLVNPTGKFVIGGPHGDTGLTGRKIIVDTYGGKGAHGGGAFSGKDSSKVDRSAAYAARHIAKNLVAAGVSSEILVQVAYAIGVADPVGLYVNTYKTAKVCGADGKILSDGEISKKVSEIFNLRPYGIVNRYGLKDPIFARTASYGHFGRPSVEEEVEVYYTDKNTVTRVVNGKNVNFKKVKFFSWEELDAVADVRKAFGL